MSKWSREGPWTLSMEAWPLKMEPRRVCGFADSHHFDEEQDPDPDPLKLMRIRSFENRKVFTNFSEICIFRENLNNDLV